MTKPRLCLLLLAALSMPALADEPASRPAFVPTVSRLVLAFSQLELKLSEAAHAGDADALGKVLADDFELRAAAMPGNSVPRAEWIARSGGAAPPLIDLSQMAVHDLGNHAVVSFQSSTRPAHPGDPVTRAFVVDVWARSGDSWRLAIRYESPSSGAVAENIAPTGKD